MDHPAAHPAAVILLAERHLVAAVMDHPVVHPAAVTLPAERHPAAVILPAGRHPAAAVMDHPAAHPAEAVTAVRPAVRRPAVMVPPAATARPGVHHPVRTAEASRRHPDIILQLRALLRPVHRGLPPTPLASVGTR